MAEKARLDALSVASRILSDTVASDPVAHSLVTSSEPLEADLDAVMAAAFDRGGLAELRTEKTRRLAAIAARDLCGEIELEEVGSHLTALADACLRVILADLEPEPGFAVIAMGKLGGGELNYSSDIDLMFVAEGDPQRAARTAGALVSALSDFSPEGQAYRVDLDLRPEGRDGALTRPLEGYFEYYRRWAKDWEFQALIKARAAAGDAAAGAEFIERTRAFVYSDEIPEARVHEIRLMKQRVEGHAQQIARKAKVGELNDVKLGPGGIRDIEFSVQLLQLVHGGLDHSVRSGNTLEALSSLVAGGYIANEDGAGMGVAYRWLRNVEHRLQLWQLRQLHHLPEDEDSKARIARAMGFRDSPESSAALRFERAHRGVLVDVRGRFEKLFYRPMVEALSGTGGRLSQEALNERLRVLGFRDAKRAARTLQGLVSGTSRRTKLFRLLTPPLLRFLADTPLPDEGLLGFLRLGETLHGRVDVLGSFRDNPPGIALLAKVLGSGKLLGEILAQVPEELAIISGADKPPERRDREALVHGSVSSLGWRGPDRLLEGLRRFKKREMLRIALADTAGTADVEDVALALSDLAEAVLEAALHRREISFAVIGMGKLGGRELGYASDLDVMFVYDGDQATGDRTASEVLKAVGEVTPEGQAFRIDADLRPEGRSGPLARSIDSYLEYYGRWSQPWEHQALIKARFVAGDVELGRKLIEGTRDLAFPEHLTAPALTEIRHLKARMEKERVPRGTDPRRNLKLGPGGMSDIEFAAQILQLQHGRHVPYLRLPGTIETLEGARAGELLSDSDTDRLVEGYRFLMRLRNRLFLMHGRPVDALPGKPEESEALGIAMGFTDQPRQELEDAFLRLTRRARRVCERTVFGGRRD